MLTTLWSHSCPSSVPNHIECIPRGEGSPDYLLHSSASGPPHLCVGTLFLQLPLHSLHLCPPHLQGMTWRLHIPLPVQPPPLPGPPSNLAFPHLPLAPSKWSPSPQRAFPLPSPELGRLSEPHSQLLLPPSLFSKQVPSSPSFRPAPLSAPHPLWWQQQPRTGHVIG